MSTENRIHLKGDFQREELVAAGTIKPGYLIEQTSAGKFQAHSTEGGYAERIVAVEDALQGNTISDDYSADDLVSANIEAPGNVVQMYLKAGENAAIDDDLISAGDGTLIENGSETSGTTVRQIIGKSQEAKDLSGSGAVNTLIAVRLL
jgi:hypothetical protein